VPLNGAGRNWIPTENVPAVGTIGVRPKEPPKGKSGPVLEPLYPPNGTERPLPLSKDVTSVWITNKTKEWKSFHWGFQTF
jgi:hypothetical protein